MLKASISSDQARLESVSMLDDFRGVPIAAEITLRESVRTLRSSSSEMSVSLQVPYDMLAVITNPGTKFTITIDIEAPE